MLESGLLCSFCSHFEVSMHDSDFVVILVNLAFELGIFSALFLYFSLEFVLHSFMGVDLSFEFQVEFVSSLLEFPSLVVPVLVFFGLLVNPLLVSTLQTGDFCF